MKDDLPAVGPEFDLSQKEQPQPYFGAKKQSQEKIIDMSPEMFDKLINIFRTKDEEEWIGLLASWLQAMANLRLILCSKDQSQFSSPKDGWSSFANMASSTIFDPDPTGVYRP